jgi:thiamine-phosphate pyrophosphorylase
MSRRDQERQPERTRFILFTPPIEDAVAFAPVLAAACSSADIAAVVLHFPPTSDQEILSRIRILAPGPHKVGAAILLRGLTSLVVPSNADGVLVNGPAAVSNARDVLGDGRIVGAGRLESRHDAMVAGENGADYVLFGEADESGNRPTLPSLNERVTWWTELFQLPCVAYAARTEEIEYFARARTDFIGLGSELVWDAPDGPVAALQTVAKRLASAEPVQ